jgi:hypothetical protein
MLYDPAWEKDKIELQPSTAKRQHSLLVYGRWFRYKYFILSKLAVLKTIFPKSKRKAA